MVGHDAEETRATADAVSRALDVRAVCLLARRARGRLVSERRALPCRPGPFPGSWELVGGTAEDAAVCGSDPTSGLVASLGFACVVCVVGVAREPCLGEDAAGAGATRAGRRAAVTSGVPTVVAAVPTTSASAPVAGARDALERLLRVMRNNKTLSLEALPKLSPRAHFPFPTNGRWASLGTRAFPWPDAEMAAAAEGAATRRAGDFANEDCWSLGGGASAFGGVVGDPRRGGAGSRPSIDDDDERSVPHDAPSLRASLREAFRDGDVFVCVSAPPRWKARGENGFAACRPGVLWRQERVRAEFSDESATRTRRAGDTNDTNDAFGRTLPLNTLGDVRGNVGEGGEGGARFVRQLATERASLRGDATGNETSARSSRPSRRAPRFGVRGRRRRGRGGRVRGRGRGRGVPRGRRRGGGDHAPDVARGAPVGVAPKPLGSKRCGRAAKPGCRSGSPRKTRDVYFLRNRARGVRFVFKRATFVLTDVIVIVRSFVSSFPRRYLFVFARRRKDARLRHFSSTPLTYTIPFSTRFRSRRMRSRSTSPSTMMSVVMSSSAVTIFTFICSLRPAFSM